MHNLLKKRCLDLYQHLQQLSIDERLMKSKARTHLRQYIRSKPTKWGFKYWIIADPTGYTVDFDVYGGSRQFPERSDTGLVYNVVMKNLCSHFNSRAIFYTVIIFTVVHSCSRI